MRNLQEIKGTENYVCVPTKGGTYCGPAQAPDPLWFLPTILIAGIIGGLLVSWLGYQWEKYIYRKWEKKSNARKLVSRQDG